MGQLIVAEFLNKLLLFWLLMTTQMIWVHLLLLQKMLLHLFGKGSPELQGIPPT